MRLLVAVCILSLLTAFPTSAFAAETMTAAEIVAIDRALDGTRMTLSGEAIGEDLRADAQHRWVNVLSGGVALGVYAPSVDAAAIEHYGTYAGTGDMVTVTGIVNVACDQHAGEFDVHAESLRIVSSGASVAHPPQWWKGFAGVAAIVIGMLEWRAFRRVRWLEVG